MNLTRQERRRRERQAYKDSRKKDSDTYEMSIKLLQPWSTPIMKTELPPKILQTMTEISDQVIADKDAESWGKILQDRLIQNC